MTEITVNVDDLDYTIGVDSEGDITEITVTDADNGEVRFDRGGVWGDGTTYTAVLDAFLLTVDTDGTTYEVRDFIESVAFA